MNIFGKKEINFLQLNLFDSNLKISEEEYSLIYLSNIHEWVVKENYNPEEVFKQYIKNIQKIKVNDLTKWIFTCTRTRQGKIHTGKIDTMIIKELFEDFQDVRYPMQDNGAP